MQEKLTIKSGMYRISLLLFAGLTIVVGGNSINANAQTSQEIRLVLQVTVDGLRGDLLNRYQAGFGKDGFRYLLRHGTVYTNAHYQHANTETIVGHTTLATGTFPSQHGMIGNVWFDREAGELAYNIEDPDSPILPTRENESTGEQVDPAQKKSRTQGPPFGASGGCRADNRRLSGHDATSFRAGFSIGRSA